MGGSTKPSQAPLVNQSSITSAIMAGVPASRPRGLRTAAAKLMPCALATWLMRSREPAMPWLPAAASASSAVSIRLRSTPSRVEDEASTSSGSIRLSRNSAFSRAIELGLADDHGEGGQDRDVGRTTSGGRQPAVHVGAEFDRVGLGGGGAEDHVGPARRTFPSARRRAGLQDERAALRAARNGHRAARADEGSDMVGVADLAGVGEHAALAVHHQRVSVPAIPQGAAGLQHIVRPVIAIVLRRHPVHAAIARLVVGRRGDDVPGRAAAAQQVERSQAAGDLVGLVEGSRDGVAETEMARHARHQRQHRHRVDQAELAAATDIVGEAVLVQVRQAQPVGKEAGIEARMLEQPRQVFVALGIPDVVQRRGRVAPGAGVARRGPRLQVRHQVHLARYGHAGRAAKFMPEQAPVGRLRTAGLSGPG